MSARMSWLFHSRSTQQSPGQAAGTSRALFKEEKGTERRREAPAAEGAAEAGLTNRSPHLLFADFAALAHRQHTLWRGLTPIHEKAALLSFVGTGITDAHQYVDVAAAFNQFLLTAPPQEDALIQVFQLKLRAESKGSDFLYLHFAGDPIVFGLLICALTGGGLMAGWRRN